MLIQKFDHTLRSKYYGFFAIFICSLTVACFPPVQEDHSSVHLDYSDPVVISILNFADEHKTDSLLSYLSHQDAKYRLIAAQSFWSVRDSVSISKLSRLLTDPIEKVREAAAIALGQIGKKEAEESLTKAFIAVDSVGPYLNTNRHILEALGKTGTDQTLQQLCEVQYLPKDSLLSLGLATGIYRFGIRNLFCKNAKTILFQLVANKDYSHATRLMAAHSIQRFKALDFTDSLETLKRLCVEEKNPEIRMCLVAGLARTGAASALTLIEELYSRGLDVRVMSNAIKGLSSYKNGQATSIALRAAQNPSEHVAIPALEYLIEYGQPEKYEEYQKLVDQSSYSWRLNALAYQLALKKIPYYMILTREGIESRIKQKISTTKNPYEKATFIKLFADKPKELYYLLSLDQQNNKSVVRTALMETIGSCIKNASFELVFPGTRNPIYPIIANFIQRKCTDADAGECAAMAELFMNAKPLVIKYCQADSILQVAQSKLSLPKDIETYNALQETICKLTKTSYKPRIAEFTHPIDWKEFATLQDTFEVLMKTEKGELRLQLYKKMAPGTVVNFVQLIKSGFYKSKYFHRVVPNFVVQVGCPRGDGYGALDYCIRTEISKMNYLESGMVGMASAGADTEGTQFFITHSPTPHLDGRYTVFGKLVGGFDVLMSIYQGDELTDIQIAN
ncbi:MAG TPA: peptidylprolyl isomerase [Saprospiraceae bacterium]|nr:peptidylprolyl isomerase [Saprospiraceae bacterium]